MRSRATIKLRPYRRTMFPDVQGEATMQKWSRSFDLNIHIERTPHLISPQRPNATSQTRSPNRE